MVENIGQTTRKSKSTQINDQNSGISEQTVNHSNRRDLWKSHMTQALEYGLIDGTMDEKNLIKNDERPNG